MYYKLKSIVVFLRIISNHIYIYIYFSMRTATNNKAMMNFDYLRHKRYTVDTFGKTVRHSTSVIFSKIRESGSLPPEKFFQTMPFILREKDTTPSYYA